MRAGLARTALVLLLTACSRPPGGAGVADSGAEPRPPNDVEGRHGALVTRVIDGDTIEVRYRGRELDVRLIGIDTPETVAPGRSVECGGPAASRFTERRLEGERVGLEFDVERLDRYGRTLAYVWLGDRLFNRTLVAKGYAQVTTYPPNVKYVDVFRAAQRRARERNVGLWRACADAPSGLVGGSSGSARCDPAYPDACIPPPPPDLDCVDVRFDHFAVRPPDPHNFDGDHNGIGCEFPA